MAVVESVALKSTEFQHGVWRVSLLQQSEKTVHWSCVCSTLVIFNYVHECMILLWNNFVEPFFLLIIVNELKCFECLLIKRVKCMFCGTGSEKGCFIKKQNFHIYLGSSVCLLLIILDCPLNFWWSIPSLPIVTASNPWEIAN